MNSIDRCCWAKINWRRKRKRNKSRKLIGDNTHKKLLNLYKNMVRSPNQNNRLKRKKEENLLSKSKKIKVVKAIKACWRGLWYLLAANTPLRAHRNNLMFILKDISCQRKKSMNISLKAIACVTKKKLCKRSSNITAIFQVSLVKSFACSSGSYYSLLPSQSNKMMSTLRISMKKVKNVRYLSTTTKSQW